MVPEGPPRVDPSVVRPNVAQPVSNERFDNP